MIKTNKGNRLVPECTVSAGRRTWNSDLDLPDLPEAAKWFVVKNSKYVHRCLSVHSRKGGGGSVH